MATKYFYKFYGDKADGDDTMVELLGGKGAALAQMSRMGVPVPAGFTLTTSLCKTYYGYKGNKARSNYAKKLGGYTMTQYRYLTKHLGYAPLVSVRSGAAVSMPGMMDTILNVGMTSASFPYWQDKLGERGCSDCFRRLIQMYGTVVKNIPAQMFENIISDIKDAVGVEDDSELDATAMGDMTIAFLDLYMTSTNEEFPDTIEEQFAGCIEAVFQSWNSPRAIAYREMTGISGAAGTAINVQRMVFGNLNSMCASGVMFTRDPSTGEDVITGEYLVNAQGEDVVAGIRTPESIATMQEWNKPNFEALSKVAWTLEKHYGDMQDIEFTIENGVMYILQTRSGKRSSMAKVRIAYEMWEQKLIEKEAALAQVTGLDIEKSCQPVLVNAKPVDGVGIAAGGGVVTGRVTFGSEMAVATSGPTILIRHETTPDDIVGMNASVGILTATGGLTSHAAVVARGMNKTCVVGCDGLKVGPGDITLNGKSLNDGDWITISGATGGIWLGKEEITTGEMPPTAMALIELAGGVKYQPIQNIDLTMTGVVIQNSAKGWLLMPSRLALSCEDEAYLDLVGGSVDASDDIPPWGDHLIAELGANAYYVPEWFSDVAQAKLEGAGVSKARVAKTVADMMTGGVVYCEDGFIKEIIGGDEAAQQLVAMMAGVGITTHLAKRQLTLIEVAYEIFG